MFQKNKVISIFGPTAVGKTNFSISLAKKLNCSIISCDSRQFYKELNIGTAKPTLKEMRNIPHAFIDHISIENEYSAGEYENKVTEFLQTYFLTKQKIILIGGSGMYLDVIINGINHIPKVNPQILKELNNIVSNHGLRVLVDELKIKDPEVYKQIDIQNPRRVIRAISVFRQTGKSILYFQNKKPKKRNFINQIFVLTLPREILYEKINSRVDIMIQKGLIEEAKNLYKHRHLKPLQTIGYKELFDYFENKTSLNKAIELIKQNSRRYAKKQITWLKKYTNAIQIDMSNSIQINSFIKTYEL